MMRRPDRRGFTLPAARPFDRSAEYLIAAIAFVLAVAGVVLAFVCLFSRGWH